MTKEMMIKGITKITYIIATAFCAAVIAYVQNWLSANGIHCGTLIHPDTAVVTGTTLAIGAHLIDPTKIVG